MGYSKALKNFIKGSHSLMNSIVSFIITLFILGYYFKETWVSYYDQSVLWNNQTIAGTNFKCYDWSGSYSTFGWSCQRGKLFI